MWNERIFQHAWLHKTVREKIMQNQSGTMQMLMQVQDDVSFAPDAQVLRRTVIPPERKAFHCEGSPAPVVVAAVPSQ